MCDCSTIGIHGRAVDEGIELCAECAGVDGFAVRTPEQIVLDVVFIHGLDGDAIKTWSRKETESSWPSWLAEEFADVAVWAVGYDAWSSGWRGQAMPMQDRAVNLMAALQNHGIGERPLCFVTHSMGGLLAKEILLHAAEGRTEYASFATAIRGVVFLATPHTGAGLTKAVDALGVLYRGTPAVEDLARNNAHLRQMNDRYRNWVDEAKVRHLVFFETHHIKGLRVVDEVSANPGLARVTPIGVDANHIDICKPADRESLVYGQVRRFIATVRSDSRREAGLEESGSVTESVPAATAKLIADKTASFVGRDYVFRAIKDFIASTPSGYLTIEGDPGAGKTTILAEYVRRNGCVAHFNIRSQSLNTSRHFIRSFGSHLAVRYGITPVPQGIDPEGYGEVLSRLLIEARSSLAAEEPLVLVVDALDEVNTAGDPPGANVFFLPQHLPTGVHFVLSSRRASVPLQTDTPNRIFDLGQHHNDTMEDVREYLELRAREPRIGAWLSGQQIQLSDFLKTLAKKSEGNFMYLRHVLHDLAGGHYQDLDIRRLPQGLEQYYESHWRLMGMAAAPSSRLKVWVIYLLSEIAQPVSARALASFLLRKEPGVDAIAVQQVLQEWRQFLHRDETSDGPRFSLYHASFQDFLHRKDTVASAGLVLGEVNEVIADLLWDLEFGDGAEPA